MCLLERCMRSCRAYVRGVRPQCFSKCLFVSFVSISYFALSLYSSLVLFSCTIFSCYFAISKTLYLCLFIAVQYVKENASKPYGYILAVVHALQSGQRQ